MSRLNLLPAIKDAGGLLRYCVENFRRIEQWANPSFDSYRYLETVYFTSNGSFVKADYPNLKAVRVKLVGGGGAGAGSTTVNYGGAGGGGGGYAEAFVTEDLLNASEAITVGSGGGAGTGTGGNGGSSSFGAHCSAGGGHGGHSSTGSPYWGGEGGIGNTGDLLLAGQGGGGSIDPLAPFAVSNVPGIGGSSVLGGGANSPAARQANATGENGRNYGGGGSGGFSRTTNVNGGNGASGIVIVELYA